MQWTSHEKWALRASAFGVSLLLAASLSYWWLHWPRASSVPALVGASTTELPPPDSHALAKILGAKEATESAAPLAPNRLQLIGIVARHGGNGGKGAGAAIIAIDGKPPRAYAVGAQVEAGLVVQSVSTRKVVLAASMQGAALQTLEMPSATSASSAGAPSTMPAPTPMSNPSAMPPNMPSAAPNMLGTAPMSSPAPPAMSVQAQPMPPPQQAPMPSVAPN